MRWMLIVAFAIAGCGENAPAEPQRSAPQERVVIPDSSRGPCEVDSDCRKFQRISECGCGCYAILASARDPVCTRFHGEEGCVGNRCPSSHAACDPATHQCVIVDGPTPSAPATRRFPPTLDHDAKTRLRTALREGRRAPRAGQHATALAHLLLGASPASDRLIVARSPRTARAGLHR